MPSAFYDRFTEPLVRCLVKLIAVLIEKMTENASRPLAGALAGFKDVVVFDSTVLRLHEYLAKKFPGSRTNHSKAAAKLHVALSVVGAGPRTINVTSGRTHDGKAMSVGAWVAGKLLIFGLGLYSYRLFDNIRRNTGSFVSLFKINGNPLIVANNRPCRGASVKLVGKRLQEVLPSLQRLYRARWTIELLFKSLKSDFAIDDLPSEKPAIAQALLYASIITWLVGQEVLAMICERLKDKARRVTGRRGSRLLHECASDLLRLLVGPRGQQQLAVLLDRHLLHEAPDPHRRRASLIEEVEAEDGLAALVA